MMIDHIWLPVRDYEKSKDFYTVVLSTLDYHLSVNRPDERRAGFGVINQEGHRDFWIIEDDKEARGSRYCIAFRARNADQVNAFHRYGLAAGGTDNGKPGYRLHYHSGYYAAFILDPDGYNIEAVYDARFWK